MSLVILALIFLSLITGCSENNVEVRKGNGLQQEVTGSAVAINYAEADVENKTVGEAS